MNEKITLLFPPGYIFVRKTDYSPTPPIGLAQIAALLEHNGFEVTGIDSHNFMFSEDTNANGSISNEQKFLEKIILLVEKTNPALLIISAWTKSVPFISEFVKSFKKRNPEIKILLGGITSEIIAEEIMKLIPNIDFLKKGENINDLPFFVKKIFNKEKDFTDIKGLLYYQKKQLIDTGEPEILKNMDELPIVDFSQFKDTRKVKYMTLVSSVGCPYRCVFCSYIAFRPKKMFFSEDHFEKQLKVLKDKFGDFKLYLYDDNFLVKKDKAHKIARIIKKYDIPWSMSTRSDLLDEKDAKILKETNCETIFFGVENLIPKTIEFFNKAFKPKEYIDKTYESLKLIKKYDLKVVLAFIAGTPTETKEEIFENLQIMKNINEKYFENIDHIEYAILRPEIGSNLWNRVKKGEFKITLPKSKKLIQNYSGAQLFSNKYSQNKTLTISNHIFKSKIYTTTEFEKILVKAINFYDKEIKDQRKYKKKCTK